MFLEKTSWWKTCSVRTPCSPLAQQRHRILSHLLWEDEARYHYGVLGTAIVYFKGLGHPFLLLGIFHITLHQIEIKFIKANSSQLRLHSWTATRLLCCPARTNLLRVSASSAISSNRPSAVPDVAWSSRATSWRRINLSARVARSTRTVLYTNHTLNKFFTIFHTVNFLHVIKSVLQAKYIKQLIVKSRHAYVSKILLV